MGSFGNDAQDDVISGINITPLVDVILVLLIVFMITAPVIYQSAIHVDLPKAASGEQTNQSSLTFSLTKGGELLWKKEKISWETLDERLSHLEAAAKNETALISADTDTSHGNVIRLMDSLRQAGVLRFALNVDGTAKPTQ